MISKSNTLYLHHLFQITAKHLFYVWCYDGIYTCRYENQFNIWFIDSSAVVWDGEILDDTANITLMMLSGKAVQSTPLE